MELTQNLPTDRQVIERYGAGGFRVSGIVHPGAVLVLPDRTLPWPVSDVSGITTESLAALFDYRRAHSGQGERLILLLGLGRRVAPVGAALREGLRAAGIALEAMDTGAACRTYLVLVGEDRAVAAALLPPV